MLTAEASAREAVATRDSAALSVKDEEDHATLVEREALERVLRAEVENATTLASTCEDAEGLAQNNSRSSPFCGPGVLSCVIPSSVPHG
jgi:hypothetical protein